MSDLPIDMMKTCMVERLQVGICLLQGDYAGAERIRDEMQASADHLTQTIADHKAKYAAMMRDVKGEG